MIFALILTPVFVLLSFADTAQFSAVLEQAEVAVNKDFTDLFTSTTPLGLLSLAAWGLGYFGQPHVLARFMAADSVKSLIKARRISMTWMVLLLRRRNWRWLIRYSVFLCQSSYCRHSQ